MGEGGWENQCNASHTLRSKAGRRWNAVRSRVSDSARLSNPETGAGGEEGSRCQVSVEEKNWKAHEKGPSLVWLALNQAILTSRWWGRPSAPVTGKCVCPFARPREPAGPGVPPAAPAHAAGRALRAPWGAVAEAHSSAQRHLSPVLGRRDVACQILNLSAGKEMGHPSQSSSSFQ